MTLVKEIDRDLKGVPDRTLTWVLLGIGVFTIIMAFTGNPSTKAILAAWLIAP